MAWTTMRGGVRPSRAASVVAAIVGLGMLFTVLMFFVQPVLGIGSFVLLWVVALLSIIGFHLYNAFSRSGVSHTEFHVNAEHGASPADSSDFAERLRDVEHLFRDGMIDEQEYEHKRQEIMRSKW